MKTQKVKISLSYQGVDGYILTVKTDDDCIQDMALKKEELLELANVIIKKFKKC